LLHASDKLYFYYGKHWRPHKEVLNSPWAFSNDELIGQAGIKITNVSKNPKLWKNFEQVQKFPQ
jgi:hypothetical protein